MSHVRPVAGRSSRRPATRAAYQAVQEVMVHCGTVKSEKGSEAVTSEIADIADVASAAMLFR